MSRWKETALNEFDSWSRSYDKSPLQRLFFRPSHDAILGALSIREHSRVLDIGCGTGQFARRLLDEQDSIDVVGLDLSEKMLQKARDNCWIHHSRFEAVSGDSEDLPFESSSFDVVTCSHSFHHYPNQKAVVAEMFRVLKSGGQLCIVDGNRDGWWGWLVFDWFVTAIERRVHHCSAANFRQLLENAGFQSLRQTSYGTVAPFLLTQAIADKPEIGTLPLRRAA